MSWSATTTFSTVLDEFYDSGFNYIEDNSQTARAKRWVNQSYAELCGLERWPFLRSSATGTSPLTIADLGDVIYVTDTTNDVRLIEADENILSKLDPQVNDVGNPTYYYLTDSGTSPQINVFPTTSVSLSVKYWITPTELSADSDVLVVPNQFIDLVVLGAMRRAYLDGTDTAGQYQLVTAEMQSRMENMRKIALPNFKWQEITWASEDW